MPSILRILDQPQPQSRIVEKAESGFQAELLSAKNRLAAPETIESELAPAPELANPVNSEPPNAGKSTKEADLAELLRTITKFEESNQPRVVDFFE